VTQNRPGPPREDRRQPHTFARQARPSERVHASMHRMKAPTGKPVAYRPSAKTEAQQLRACHHSVLPTR